MRPGKEQVKPMKNNRVVLLTAAVIMGLGIFFICLMCVSRVSGREERGGLLFSIGGNAELRNTIEIPLEDVDYLDITSGGKNVEVYFSKEDAVIIKEYLYSGDSQAVAKVSYQDEKKVVVTGAQRFTFVVFGFWNRGERMEVYIPEKSLMALSIETGSGNITSDTDCIREEGSLVVETGSGNIRWRNAVGKEILFQAGSGNIKLENIRGNGELYVGSGNITGDEIEGSFRAQAGSGNITLSGFCGEGSVEAGSGNVRVKAMAVTGDMEITTGSGNISLKLPKEAGFHFQAETGSGNINTDFDEVLSYNKKGNFAEGKVEAGSSGDEVEIRVRANSGNVRVSNR